MRTRGRRFFNRTCRRKDWCNGKGVTERERDLRVSGRFAKDTAEVGVRLPKNSKFWKKYFPPNGWNCRCTAIEIWKDEPEAKESFGITGVDPMTRSSRALEVPDEFIGNAGMEYVTEPVRSIPKRQDNVISPRVQPVSPAAPATKQKLPKNEHGKIGQKEADLLKKVLRERLNREMKEAAEEFNAKRESSKNNSKTRKTTTIIIFPTDKLGDVHFGTDNKDFTWTICLQELVDGKIKLKDVGWIKYSEYGREVQYTMEFRGKERILLAKETKKALKEAADVIKESKKSGDDIRIFVVTSYNLDGYFTKSDGTFDMDSYQITAKIVRNSFESTPLPREGAPDEAKRIKEAGFDDGEEMYFRKVRGLGFDVFRVKKTSAIFEWKISDFQIGDIVIEVKTVKRKKGVDKDYICSKIREAMSQYPHRVVINAVEAGGIPVGVAVDAINDICQKYGELPIDVVLWVNEDNCHIIKRGAKDARGMLMWKDFSMSFKKWVSCSIY